MIQKDAIFSVIKIIYTQSISKTVYIIFLYIIPSLLAMAFFFYFYVNDTLKGYSNLLQKSFFGYYPDISLIFKTNDRETDHIVKKIYKKLKKRRVVSSIVFMYNIGYRFKLVNDKNSSIKKSSKLIVYNESYLHHKFGKNIDIVFTNSLYEPISNNKDIYLKTVTGKIKLTDRYRVINTGFLNVEPTLIISYRLFKKLHTKLFTSQIDVLSRDAKLISNLTDKSLKRYTDIPMPDINIYSHNKKLTKVRKLFINLEKLKKIIAIILLVIIFFLFLATINTLKELKEREFKILKNLGFTTLEIISGFLIVEFFIIFTSMIVGLSIYVLYSENFNMLDYKNYLEFLLICIFVILLFTAFYIGDIFRYEKFK